MYSDDKNNLVYTIYTDKKSCTSDKKPSTIFDFRKCATMFTITFILTMLLVFGIIMISGYIGDEKEEPLPLPYLDENPATMSVGCHQLIDRSKWGGQSMLNTSKPLQLPVDLIIISHTATRFCSTTSECSQIVAAAQNYHLTMKNPDIGYNFLIGGDANIYVGRGWDTTNFHRNQSVAISFIGNYLYDELNEDMIDAVEELLRQGVKFGKLTRNYNIVCHNQTRATLSPGTNVYKIVKTWSHYSPEILI